MRLTKEEKEAIKALEKIAETWPKSLWLFSASGTLWVMKKKNGEKQFFYNGGANADFAIKPIRIDNDGGDW